MDEIEVLLGIDKYLRYYGGYDFLVTRSENYITVEAKRMGLTKLPPEP